ncbi:MAG: hypothetical protein R3F61_28285 [Myxococcota bacterium]
MTRHFVGVQMFRIGMAALLLSLGTVAAAQDSVGNELERAATATPEEMRAFATKALETIRANAKSVGTLTEKARKDADPAALDCLTPRNVSVQALVQVAEGAQAKMNEALDAGDMERASHEYRKLSVALDKSEKIAAEAESCGTGAAGSGKDKIDWTGGTGDDRDIEDDDDLTDIDVGFDPPNVSPSEI